MCYPTFLSLIVGMRFMPSCGRRTQVKRIAYLVSGISDALVEPGD